MEQFIEPFQHLYSIKPLKQLADEVHSKPITLYRFGESGEQHRTNPVEYIVALTHAARDPVLVDCVCHEVGGIFVRQPPVRDSVPADLPEARNVVARLDCEFVAAIARAVVSGGVSVAEAKSIRRLWERDKSVTEAFVRACECGIFNGKRLAVLAARATMFASPI